MINIRIKRNELGSINGFNIKGHADSDEYGKDIVCASISILSQTCVLSLHEIANIDVLYEMQDGILNCEIPDTITDTQRNKANIILETMLVGIKGVIEMYPNYIEFHDKEV